MNRLLISNARIVTPGGEWTPGWLLTGGSKIRWMAPGDPPAYPPGYLTRQIDAEGGWLLPGFIDIHTHGSAGHEVMDASVEGLQAMAAFYARHGVTAFLPTTWTATRSDITQALEAIAQVKEQSVAGSAAILGVHLEGPFLNAAKCGAQDKRFIRAASQEEAIPYLDTGLVKLMTLAPEIEGNRWLVEECQRRGITVSAGHTDVSYEQLCELSRHGIRQVTHTFSAMGLFHHRQPGTVGAALSISELSCELICDNVHIHPAAQKILFDVKTPEKVILITDSLRGAGLPEGEYDIGGRKVTFKEAAWLQNGTLAGSILTMDRALRNVIANTGRGLEELWPATSLNAARSIGVAARKGSLEVGKDADLVLLDQAYQVRLTVVEGNIA